MAQREANVKFRAETAQFDNAIKSSFWSSDILTGSQTGF